MGAVVCRITTPRFERLDIRFFKQLTFYLLRLLQFMNTANNLRFSAAELKFSDENADDYSMPFPLLSAAGTRALTGRYVTVYGQICKTLSQIFSTLSIWSLASHLKSTMRSTAPSGVNALHRLAT